MNLPPLFYRPFRIVGRLSLSVGKIQIRITERAYFLVFLSAGGANVCSAVGTGQRITFVNRFSAIGTGFHFFLLLSAVFTAAIFSSRRF